MRLFVLLPLVCGLLIAADTVKKDAKADKEKLQGTWKLPEVEGQMVIEGDKYTFKAGGSEEQGTMKLDPSKTPKTIDIQITEGNDKGKTQLGVYEVDGDTFKLCVGQAGGTDRPTAVEAKDNAFLFVFKRDKP
jgi:uncharacterized protein (TIGR03067 family)